MTRALLAKDAKAWPFELARLLLERVEKSGKTGPVVFETGYGPSGLPHIGTFGEVVRTTMVRQAFHALTDGAVPTMLLCVSDDMDGMRKVPDNVPNPASLEPYLQKPLTDVPDPFGTHAGFAQHNNARLRGFLDSFGFDYVFKSATELYRSGAFDATLLTALERYDDIMAVMLPTLGEERRATYSPFLPISPSTGRVLYVPMKATDPKAGTITFADEDGTDVTLPVTGGHVKMQWKPDFGMRWAALGVDFEMYGKDHQTNGPIYSKICRILGAEPPVQYCYELFLDQNGEKISKSKGNGISVEQWLTYAPPESLSLYNFQKPRAAKKLYFDVIPRAVDEYLQFLDAFHREEPARQLENPVWHIHNGRPPQTGSPISFGLLLNLVSAANAETKEVLWGFIRRYAPAATPEDQPLLDQLAGFALAYYRDFILPTKKFRAPSPAERAAILDLKAELEALGPDMRDGDAIQNRVFEVGKTHQFDNLRDWFKALYEVLLGQEQGPRFGGFVALFGVTETIALIDERLAAWS
ncbi:lysine-tRNA ligase [Candidatus Phycosocius bacilliformis]|uniref:Lysine--tRNA ligase n=1 Tax=Candidatus Phycosocius bacilliformis TaxID=1445552 RepID=A0A2P2E621_9PROT|nr:lysine--tRNA ligase [Candidatus Phycosocius bacilliformis]GBF56504.1 lysine-tRNA ligase [Candidatus Phycosocius bacilliformis]